MATTQLRSIFKLMVVGGGERENANEYVLHHCEHLVTKRMARKILLTRLPVGHKHDDIDGCFGIIWKYWYKCRNINNFSEFRQGVEQAFKDEDGTKCFVYETFVFKKRTLILPNMLKYASMNFLQRQLIMRKESSSALRNIHR